MNDEIQRFKKLLTTCQPILQKMDEADELRPPDFNIFEILKLERAEVRTHSALLAYFLDPRAGHNQGTLFLKAFVEILREHEKKPEGASIFTENVTQDWTCASEVYLRSSNSSPNSPTAWGQADIVIRGQKSLILIENKIDAGDQDQQLYRYWQYVREQGKVYFLVYLTLHGGSPSQTSLSGDKHNSSMHKCPDHARLEVHMILLSYRMNIRPWLQQMAKEVEAKSVSEILRQYANLLGRL